MSRNKSLLQKLNIILSAEIRALLRNILILLVGSSALLGLSIQKSNAERLDAHDQEIQNIQVMAAEMNGKLTVMMNFFKIPYAPIEHKNAD